MYRIKTIQALKAIKMLTYCLLIAFGFLFSGCEDFYMPPKNEFPGTEVAISTQNLDLVVNGMYLPIGRYHSSDYMIISELFGGNSLIYQENGSRNQNYINLRNFDLSASTGLTNSAWADCYKSINNANVVIEAVEGANSPIDKFFNSQKDRLLGEAYLIRALGNFDLIKLFGVQYSAENKSKPGIILRKTASTGENFGTLGTIGEDYDAIISDLQKAIAKLPLQYVSEQHVNFPAYKLRATRKAASALLAKVYFQMNELDLALNQINKTIGDVPGRIVKVDSMTASSPALERGSRYTNIFTARGKDIPVKEVLFFFSNVEPEVDYTSSIRKAIFNNSQAYFEGIFHYSRSYLKELYNYTDAYGSFVAKDDTRYMNYVDTVTQNSDKDSLLHSSKYGLLEKNDDIELSTFLCIPVIRSAELLLMRAEIFALKGEFDNAQKDYNAIVSRAGLDKINDALPYTELMSRILAERLKELDMEGDIFWQWKRMGAYPDPSKYNTVKYGYAPLSRNGQVYTWDSPSIQAKIPQDELDRNPEITQ